MSDMKKHEFCEHCGTSGFGSDHAEDCPNNPIPGCGTGRLDEPEVANRVIVNAVTEGFREDVARIMGSSRDETAWLIELISENTPEWWARIDGDGVTLGNMPKMGLDEFVKADGFRDFEHMKQWFRDTHGLPFSGRLIGWHPLPPPTPERGSGGNG
jgi:hypothetical protein